VYEHIQFSKSQRKNEVLLKNQTSFESQLAVLRNGESIAKTRLAALEAENESLRRNSSELLKLRDEVTRLRAANRESTQAKLPGGPSEEAKSWLARVNLLKQRLQEVPAQNTPELALLTEQDWLNAARAELRTAEDFRRAMSGLRSAANQKVSTKIEDALHQYAKDSGGAFPTDIAQLRAFLDPAVTDAMLDEWTILPADQLPGLQLGGESIITQKAAIDPENDMRLGIGPNGSGATGPQSWDAHLSGIIRTLDPVYKAYSSANGGKNPSDLSALRPFATTPEQQQALDEVVRKQAAKQNK
jgi:hypothetical protein